MLISPNSARIEVPEKWDIPGMDRIGELFWMENSSIFLSISDNCSSMRSIWADKCLIWITSANEEIPIEDLARSLSLSGVKEIRLPLPSISKHLRIVLISVLAIFSALPNVLRIFI